MSNLEAAEVAQHLRELSAINSDLKQVLNRLLQDEATDSVLRELIEELSVYVSLLEESIAKLDTDVFKLNKAIIFLLDSENVSKRQTDELKADVIGDRIKRLETDKINAQNLYAIWHNNLAIARERDARYAGMPPIEVTTQIIEAKNKIEELEKQIEDIDREIKHLKSL